MGGVLWVVKGVVVPENPSLLRPTERDSEGGKISCRKKKTPAHRRTFVEEPWHQGRRRYECKYLLNRRRSIFAATESVVGVHVCGCVYDKATTLTTTGGINMNIEFLPSSPWRKHLFLWLFVGDIRFCFKTWKVGCLLPKENKRCDRP